MAQTRQLLPATSNAARRTSTGDPCVMVIFGASGDLTRRKLIPALYNLASQQLLSREFAVVGVGRSPMTDRRLPQESLRRLQAVRHRRRRSRPVGMVRAPHVLHVGRLRRPATYPKLKELLAKVDQEHSTHGNYFFYLATAPNFFRRRSWRASPNSRPDDAKTTAIGGA